MKRTFLVDFLTGRLRQEDSSKKYHEATDRLYSVVTVRLFDGSDFKSYTPIKDNTHPDEWKDSSPSVEVGIASGSMEVVAFHQSIWPMFVGHGRVPSYFNRIMPGKLDVLPDGDITVHERNAIKQGRNCLVLRRRGTSESYEEWWVDLPRDGAVIGYTMYVQEKPHMELDIVYQETNHGWLPKAWTLTERRWNSGQLIYQEQMRVDELSLDPLISESRFDVEVKPGMLVGRVTREPRIAKKPPTNQLYRVGEGGELRQVTFEGGVERSVGWFRWWFWLVPITLALVFARWLGRKFVPDGWKGSDQTLQ